jgi:hypothetical protein
MAARGEVRKKTGILYEVRRLPTSTVHSPNNEVILSTWSGDRAVKTLKTYVSLYGPHYELRTQII